ncbi:MAG: preprotein translocase subunit SecG [Firmicutes bacterium]|nr:preprotein translocase subunit SecG [Bacillota bacterium]
MTNEVMRMMMFAEGIAPDWYFPVILIMVILTCLLAIFILLVVLLQPGNSEGLGALTGASTDTYLGKNKGKNWEGRLKKLTVIAAALLVVFCIALAILGTITF